MSLNDACRGGPCARTRCTFRGMSDCAAAAPAIPAAPFRRYRRVSPAEGVSNRSCMTFFANSIPESESSSVADTGCSLSRSTLLGLFCNLLRRNSMPDGFLFYLFTVLRSPRGRDSKAMSAMTAICAQAERAIIIQFLVTGPAHRVAHALDFNFGAKPQTLPFQVLG